MAQTRRVFISYMRGASSILDIAPSSGYRHRAPRRSINDRLQADFQRVGRALRSSMDAWKEENSEDGATTTVRAAS